MQKEEQLPTTQLRLVPHAQEKPAPRVKTWRLVNLICVLLGPEWGQDHPMPQRTSLYDIDPPLEHAGVRGSAELHRRLILARRPIESAFSPSLVLGEGLDTFQPVRNESMKSEGG